MNMFDEARSLFTVIKMCNLSQSEMAERMGVSQSYIANKLRLLKFSAEVEKRILEKGLKERHARVLLRLEDEEKQLRMIEKIASMHLSVSASEVLVDAEVMTAMTVKIGASEMRESIELFEKVLDEGIMNLKRAGVNAEKITSRYADKKYITVYIENC